MNRIVVAAAVVTLGVAGAAAAQDKIRVPYAGSFSGPFVDFGERLFNEGVLIATEEVNAAGGIKGKPLEFFKVDARSPDTVAWISEYRRLCANKDNVLMLFNSSSKMLFATYEENKRCPMVLFAPTAGAVWTFPDYGNVVFRYLPMPDRVLPIMYQKVKDKLGAKTAGISYSIDDEFSFYNMKVARKTLEEKGFKIITEQSSKMRETNFASQVASFRAANPDVIVVSHQPGDAGTFVLHLRERGIATQIVDGSQTVTGEDFWKLSQGKGKGAIGFSVYAATDPRPVVQDFIAKWRAKTGRPNAAPDAYVASTYDSVKILGKVLNEAKSLSRDDIAEAFKSIRNMETLSGTITWNAAGEVDRDNPVLVQVSDNGVLVRWGD